MFEANPPPAKSDINIYFDIISPYSYLAFTVSQHYAESWRSQGYAVHYIPVYQAGIMKGSNNTPGFLVPAKRQYSTTDTQRWADVLGISLQRPTVFPVDSLPCARVLAVIKLYHANKLAAAMAALWRDTWSPHGERLDLSCTTHLSTILSRVFTGSEVEMMLTLSRTQYFKDLVRTETEKVVRDGCFGCPWIQVVKESGECASFHGNDRWIHVVDFAGLSWDGYGVVGGREKSMI